ncbi:MAG TPA: SbcC/MukB-like Walker B domain-containing protein [Treponemataceae bacterium]|nr:SbcC/MukB-like Walker B domain-containing protein [Treponemataceae bacterium]
MITLQRVRLVNWHYFQDAIVPVGNFCLLSGDNGSGKSTIVDAIQFVMASDLRKVRFNAAASDRRGGRDLAGYIRCKLGSDSTDYLRGDAVGHVMLEFSDGNKNFAAGACVEAWKDGRTISRFWMCERADVSLIRVCADTGQPFLARQFQDQFSSSGSSFYESGSAFRRDFTARLGIWRRMSENNPYLEAFTRSIHFTPLVSVDQFVCDYILEEQTIDLSVMKQNLESYRQAEDLARATRERISSLSEVLNSGEDCRGLERVIVQQDWLKTQLERDRCSGVLKETETDLQRLSLRAREIDTELSGLGKTKLSLERERRDAEAALARDDAHLLYSQLSDRIAELSLREEDAARRVSRRDLLLNQCQSLYSLLFPGKNIDSTNIHGAEESVEKERNRTSGEYVHRVTEKEAVAAQITDVRSELSDLERGIRRLPEGPTSLRDAFIKEGINAWILADLAEVSDLEWSDAVEGWLNTLRFACIVAPEDFSKALRVYDSLPRSIAGVPLPDIGRMSADERFSVRREGSLASLVESENPWAKQYLDCVLGDVMMSDLENLKRYSKAVTKECMSWSRYTATRIKEEVYRDAWLGKAAREKRRLFLVAQRDELVLRAEVLSKEIRELESLGGMCHSLISSLAEVRFLSDSVTELSRLQEESSRLSTQRDEIDTTAFRGLQEHIKALEKRIVETESTILQRANEAGSVASSLRVREEEITRAKNALSVAERDFSAFRELHGDIATECERYVADRLKTQSPEDILRNFGNARKTAETRLYNAMRDFRSQVTVYNRAHNEMLTGELDDLPDIRILIARLADSELPDYLEKIRQARIDAESEFKEHFIARLNELIEEAKESFSEINATLRTMTFGRDQYRFTLTEKNERRGQIEIIRKTAEISEYENSLFDALIEPADRDAANELFNRILTSNLESAELRSICDYRTYFTYDIRIRDTQSVDPATGKNSEYSLSKVLKEKSGGESQTPYYVAIAASFYRFFRDKPESTIRFVLFDEAFDRLDDERIGKVLSFYRELGLQVLISVPTEKLESIAPHMDTVNLVIRHGHLAKVVDFYDKGHPLLATAKGELE